MSDLQRAIDAADEYLSRLPLDPEPPDDDERVFAEADRHHAEGYAAALQVVAERLNEELVGPLGSAEAAPFYRGLRRALAIVDEVRGQA